MKRLREPENRFCPSCELTVPWASFCTNCGEDFPPTEYEVLLDRLTTAAAEPWGKHESPLLTNPEFFRGQVELICTVLGIGVDARRHVEDIIGQKIERKGS